MIQQPNMYPLVDLWGSVAVFHYRLIEKPWIDWGKKYCSLKFSKKEYTV